MNRGQEHGVSSLRGVQQARGQRGVPLGQFSWLANQAQVREAVISGALVLKGA